nr:copper homeostasis protein cutc like [Quercus suber]
MALLEVCCFSAESAILAGRAGADRIELCADRKAGGITPPRAWLTQVKQHVRVPVFVMIRQRGGDFHYSPREFEQMESQIDAFKPEADGYVFGILDVGGNVDVERTTRLVRRAHPWPCTFHRAFDATPDPLGALPAVIATGCQALLTSGGACSASAGVEVLRQLVEHAQGRIQVMPGGGIRANNIAELRALTEATWFHSSCVLAGSERPDVAALRRPGVGVDWALTRVMDVPIDSSTLCANEMPVSAVRVHIVSRTSTFSDTACDSGNMRHFYSGAMLFLPVLLVTMPWAGVARRRIQDVV